MTYGCGAWTLTNREEQHLGIFEHKILRKIFGLFWNEDGCWRIRIFYELNELIENADIVRFIKSRRIITIYLLTAIGLSPGGSTHLHTKNTQNNTNNNWTTQITNNVEECGPCPVFASFYPGICLTTEEKARENHSQGKRNFSQVNKNLS
jgi:hypothetical protein